MDQKETAVNGAFSWRYTCQMSSEHVVGSIGHCGRLFCRPESIYKKATMIETCLVIILHSLWKKIVWGGRGYHYHHHHHHHHYHHHHHSENGDDENNTGDTTTTNDRGCCCCCCCCCWELICEEFSFSTEMSDKKYFPLFMWICYILKKRRRFFSQPVKSTLQLISKCTRFSA